MAGQARRRSRTTWVSLVAAGVGVTVAVAMVVALPELAKPVTTCALGGEEGSAFIWTPSVLVNVPMGGSAAFGVVRGADWVFSSGSVVVGVTPYVGGWWSLSPGTGELGINGGFGLANWTFFAVHNVSQAFGVNRPCSQPYVAEITSPMSCAGSGNLSAILVLPNNATDGVQPHYMPPQPCSIESATPGASAWFDTSYHSAATGSPGSSESLQLCGPPSDSPLNVSLAGPAAYPIVVSMLSGGRTIHASGSVVWAGPTPDGMPSAVYSLPSGWAWNVSTIGPGVLPTVANPSTTALLAFERSAC